MSDYRYPERFLGLEDEFTRRETSAAWILSVPMEMTTCYVGGQRNGPAAIIEASNQVEPYDIHFDNDSAREYGIATLPVLHPNLTSPQAAVESITEAVKALPLEDRVLVTLGGEHTITPGVVAALAPRYDDLMIVQIDAHTDLRDTFDGTPWSHACAMRRCLPYVSKMIQIGIRCLCREEVDFLRSTDQVQVFTAEAMHRDLQGSYLQSMAQAVAGRNVYLTIDLDGLDPSIIPAVGTPEPGGIGWYDCLDILTTVATNAHVVAMDCVELAPTLGSQASNFSAARLVYRTLNYIMLERGKLNTPAIVYGL